MIASAPSVSAAVKVLRGRGFAVCKPDPKEKKPTYRGWAARSLEVNDFGCGDQLGALGGALSDGGRPGHALVIIDLDAAAAVERADAHLPATDMSEGRPGKPRSHRYYLVPLDTIPKWAESTAEQGAAAARAKVGHPGPFKKQFRHRETGACVIDFIGTGGQCVCPPAVWRSKDGSRTERREWSGEDPTTPGEPAVVPFVELWRSVCDLASACGAKVPDEVPRPKAPPRPALDVPADALERRARNYLAKLPAAVSGQGGHNALMRAARVVVYGFDLGPDRGFRLLSEVFNPRCEPPWSDRELEHKVDDADRTHFDKPRGYLRDEPGPERNGHHRIAAGARPVPPAAPLTAPATEAPCRPAWEIIRDYFRAKYEPGYKAGDSIYSGSESRAVRRVEACAALPPDLIEPLLLAGDAPRYANGEPKGRDATPALFKKWAGTGWAGLITELPDEDAAELSAAVEMAADEFRRLVREALLMPVTLGQDFVLGRGGNEHLETKLEKIPLAKWCQRFAKPGPWRSIRDLQVWCKTVHKGCGELVYRIALRHELFAQIKADRRLSELGSSKFARRAQRYGIGKPGGQGDRPHGKSALILEDSFVADLLGTPEFEPHETAVEPTDRICTTSESANATPTGLQKKAPHESC